LSHSQKSRLIGHNPVTDMQLLYGNALRRFAIGSVD
jgi:hypothetical protein